MAGCFDSLAAALRRTNHAAATRRARLTTGTTTATEMMVCFLLFADVVGDVPDHAFL